jgi:hypothetical protein
MRKMIVSNLITLDGYASGPGGDVMALSFDTTFSAYNLELSRRPTPWCRAPRPNAGS